MTAEIEVPPHVREMQENAGNRPSTAPDASCETGQGEVSMTVFVRTYMMSILQPFAANVEELHNVVMGLSNDLLAATERGEKNGISLEEQATLLANLRSDLNHTTEQANTNQSLLETTRDEKKALYEDHEATKARLGDVDRRLISAQSSIEELQAGLKDTRCKLSKLREKQAEMDRGIAKDLNPSIDRLTADLASLDTAHNQTKQTLSDTEMGLETNTRDLKEVTRRLDGDSVKDDSAFTHITNRFQTLDDRMAEAQRHLHEKDDQDAVHDKELAEMRSRMDHGDAAHKDNQERLNRNDIAMTDHDVRAKEIDSNIKELLVFKNHLSSGRDLNKAVDILEEGIQKNADDITSLKDLTGTHAENLRQDCDRLALFDEARENLQARMKRAEKTIGLEAYRKEETFEEVKKPVEGQFTEEQIAAFREIFDQFDTDGGGAVTTAELGDVMRKLGQEPSEEMLASMIDEVDTDGSGEIEFDEFCVLMGKSMGKDGKVDTSKGAQNAIDNMSLVAKQKQALETMNKHTTEIRQNFLDLQALKTMPTVVRIEALESQASTMTEEMGKMSQGLDLTHEYWKGLSKGLRETKRSVHTEGEVLPSAHKLRTTLPLIAKRPGTSGSMPGGSMTAR